MITRYATGSVYSGEVDILLRPNTYSDKKYPIIFCHGAEAGGGGADWMSLKSRWNVFLAAIDGAGRYGISSDLGGSATWGNDLAQGRMNLAFATAQAMGQLTGKVVLVAQSMGATTALAWAAANPTKVAKIVLVIPVINLKDVRDNSIYQGAIDLAYGGTYVDSVQALTHNPLAMGQAGKFSSIPILLFYGDSDTLCLPAYAVQFAIAAGQCSAVPVSGGHAEDTVGKVPYSVISDFLS